ncbi:NAD-dependent protein deacylase [Halomicrobium sp. HM KBTZ05]|uniref:NAD-dependent protein deacylase n=1 Tax=Halomicrobium sp. HM KBTZ05 TaxID=3242663 RepID=UPI003558D9CC
MDQAIESKVADLVASLRESDTAVVLTGAGVSTASGIPAFRGEDGLWSEFDPKAFHRRRLDADPAGFWADRLELRERLTGGGSVAPNAAHEAIATLEAEGHVDAVVTQNVDGLHREAGTEDLIELHGTNERVVCDDCGRRTAADPVFERAAGGERPPRCECGGVLRPDVVLFGESLPGEAIERANRLAHRADWLLVAGSSLTVDPAAGLPGRAARSGATVGIVNLDPTEKDDAAAIVVRADVTTILPAIERRV